MVSNDAKTTAATTLALTTSGKPKEKRRNNEKRKEKSRDAARCRRSRETEIFSDLAQILPLRKEDVNQLDKASVMRIAISYLKVREMLPMFPKIQDLTDSDIDDNSNSASPMSNASSKQADDKLNVLKCAEESLFIKHTLDGFLLVLSNDGDITYISDNIIEYLGLTKIDMLGQQIWEYSHQCDHAELKEALNIKRKRHGDTIKDENMIEEGLSTDHRDLFVRLKCTLTSRGRNINIKSASYKVIHITGHLVVNMKGDRVLIAIGRSIPHPSNIEIPLGSTTFLTKHSLDMKFTYVDEKMKNLFGYKAEDLLEQSLFLCHHGGDSDSLMATFKTVLSKGQGETCRYRFLGKYGGYCWIVTQATIVYDKLKPQGVVCVNYVVSNLENDNEIFSLAQYEASKHKVEESNSTGDQSHVSDSYCNNNNNNSSSNNINSNNNNSTDADKKQLKEILNVNKLKIEQTHQQNIKTPNSPPTPELPPITDNDPNADCTTKTDNLCVTIKREKSPEFVAKSNTTSINVNTTTTTNLNTSSSKPLDTSKSFVRENSLSPLRRNLQSNCLIGNVSTVNNNKNHLFIPKSLEEKRPKSVTASVFRPATAADLSATTTSSPQPQPPTVPSTTSTSAVFVNANASSLPPLNVACRAQSVTASVFTPISQLCNKQQTHIVKTNSVPVTATLRSSSQQEQQQQSPKQQQQPQQQDMNKFLSFGDDATELTMLKEEPDDLSHLVPNAAADCMRLDDTAPFFGEMLVGLMNTYGSFLPDDYSSLDSTTDSSSPNTPNGSQSVNNISNTNNAHNCSGNRSNQNSNSQNSSGSATHKQSNSTTNNNLSAVTLHNQSNNNNNNGISSNNCNKAGVRIDPFINYREESNDTNCSQHLLSPSAASKSPEANSLPSLCSPNSLSQDDGFAFMTMSVDVDIDMNMRAPYIPMNEQEDLPLLTADDLMWCANNGLGSEELNMQKDVDATVQQLQLQQLQLQQQHSCDNNQNLLSGYPDAQHINQSHFNSLCSSPASTVSSLSPSPVNHQQQHQQHQQQQSQQQDTNSVYSTDTSELAALLCGAGNGTLSILNNNCGSSEGASGDLQDQQNQQTQSQHSHCASMGGGGSGGAGVGEFRLQQLQQELAAEQQEQQQRQTQLLGLSIDCKKESSLSSNLCDSIEEAFENVYSKDSTNLDCWNELLQINVSDTSSSALSSPLGSLTSPQEQQPEDRKSHLQLVQQLAPQHQHQHDQQNVILNAVPLITIQSNKNILLQQQQQQQQQLDVSNKMIINDEILPANRGGNKITTIKLVNGQATAATAVSTPLAATIRIIDGKQQQFLQQRQNQQQTRSTKGAILQQQQQQQQQQQSHKRHLASSLTANQVETKRMRNVSVDPASVELHTVPQLLQQLVAPVQQREQLRRQPQQKQQQSYKVTGGGGRWSSPADSKTAIDNMQQANTGLKQQQQQPQQSNSVLKNLLISGCDESIYAKQEPIHIDDNTLEQAPSSPISCLSPLSLSLSQPLNCRHPTAAMLRSYHHNPMIGGPGVLPSPPFGPCGSRSSSDDSKQLSLVGSTSIDAESNSDSGIDDIGMTEGDNESSQLLKTASGCATTSNDMLLMECWNTKTAIKRSAVDTESQPKQQQSLASPIADDDNINESGNFIGSGPKRTRKLSGISFLEPINPLLEPFIMSLCNDDYNVNTEQFMGPNEIELCEWTRDIA